jgi:predicted HTH transcriptional regulator
MGISTTAIENNIKSLKDSNILRRAGSDKAGTWEIIDEI